MWTCSHCRASIPQSFAVCWQCGASRSGEVDGEFLRAEDVDEQELVPLRPTTQPPPLPPWRWQFGIASILSVTTIVAIVAAIIPPKEWPSLAMVIVLLFAIWVAAFVIIALIVYTFGNVAYFIGGAIVRERQVMEKFESNDADPSPED